MAKTNIFEHWVFFVNPSAGHGRTTRILRKLNRLLRHYHLHSEVIVTQSAHHASSLACAKADAGADYLVAVGGDGTVNEIVNGIMQSTRRKQVRLGILPLGGGNDLARSLGISSHWETSFRQMMRKRAIWLDIGRFEDTWFANNIGIGFDAEIAGIAAKTPLLNGLLRYLWAFSIGLLGMHNRKFGIRLDDDLFRRECLLITAGNGRFCGGGIRLTPDADPTDGLLDVCIVRKASRLRVLHILPKALRGQHTGEPEVEFRRSGGLTVECRDADLHVYYDGEIPVLKRPRRVHVRLFPHQVRVICPQGATA